MYKITERCNRIRSIENYKNISRALHVTWHGVQKRVIDKSRIKTRISKNTINVCVFRTLKCFGLWLRAEGDSMFCLFALHRHGHAYDVIGLCRQQRFSAKERSESFERFRFKTNQF